MRPTVQQRSTNWTIRPSTRSRCAASTGCHTFRPNSTFQPRPRYSSLVSVLNKGPGSTIPLTGGTERARTTDTPVKMAQHRRWIRPIQTGSQTVDPSRELKYGARVRADDMDWPVSQRTARECAMSTGRSRPASTWGTNSQAAPAKTRRRKGPNEGPVMRDRSGRNCLHKMCSMSHSASRSPRKPLVSAHDRTLVASSICPSRNVLYAQSL